MPLLLTPFSQNAEYRGCVWTISDIDKLADLVALVYRGCALHVEKILAAGNPTLLPSDSRTIQSAIEKLSLKNKDHRDGLLFQTISWIAAHCAAKPTMIFAVPHLIPAHKGFDGLQVDVNPVGPSGLLVVFEDKATQQPRKTITDDVWPQLRRLSKGERRPELINGVLSLLAQRSQAEADAVIGRIWSEWQRLPGFRVSITGVDKGVEVKHTKLFKGFDEVAPGDVERRRAEVIYLSSLRAWMDDFALKVIASLQKGLQANV
jgi:hypothetical protein